MEPKQTRLFIGNLLPAISNSALKAALSKFGVVKNLTRNADRNFAHASLCPSDDKAVDKCLSVLNQTRWFGTVLRVEIATENFQSRLQREWGEQEEVERVSKLAALAARREKLSEWKASKSDIPDRFSWKGKRTTFYVSVKDTGGDNETANLIEEDRDLPTAAGKANRSGKVQKVNAPEVSKSSEATRPVSKPVAATLDLFGLNVAEEEPVVEIEIERPSPAKRVRGNDALSSAKERSLMEAIEDDPTKMDVPAEKDLARAIVEKMFSFAGGGRGKANHLEEAVQRHRRKALYRKLLGDTAEEADFTASLQDPSIGKSIDCESSIEKHRRKGMCRDLITV